MLVHIIICNRRVEKIALIIFTIFCSLYTFICLLIGLPLPIWSCEISDGNITGKRDGEEIFACILPKLLDEIKGYIDCTIYFILLITGIILHIKVTSSLQKNLNFYYKQTRNSLIFLTLGNCCYFSFLLITTFAYAIPEGFVNGLNTVPHINLNSNYTVSGIISLLCVILIGNIPLYFIAYFNIKGINFKNYLRDIMSGFGIQHLYNEEISLFICK